MARQVLENGVILPAEYSDDWYDDMTSNLTKLDDVIGSDSEKLSSADVGAAALSNNYNDLDNLPTIPTVNDATLTIQKNGVDVQTFTANASSNVTANITVPTKTSDLNNDSNFVDTSNSAVASGITSAKVTAYDSHIADTDIHVTTADKNKWNNGVSQAYVFRYSSTALVASSTNSNTLLDNTDNLKVGDKVIDSSGVLFSITAIDTANSTFTVGSALIDLALDANVVHTSGNETVGGEKIFTNDVTVNNSNATVQADVPNLIFQNPLMERASTTLEGEQTILFTDKNDNNIGSIQAKTYTSGTSDIILTSYSEYNGVKTTGIVIRRTPTTSKLQGFSDNITSLGDTNRRWSKVYAMNYYYGSNNVEFSTKFVTTDTSQTISGAKTFSDNLTIYNSDDTQTPKGLTIRNAQWGMGESGGVTTSNINFLDKNSSVPASIIASKGLYGQSYLRFSVRTKDSQNNALVEEIYYDIDTSGNVEFRSWHDNIISLGTSVYKWKDVNTYLVNGLTPSSLSLPNYTGSKIDISSYITNLTGGSNNYTAPANGYIFVRTTNGTYIKLTEYPSGVCSSVCSQTADDIGTFLPVNANRICIIAIKCSSIDRAYFVPCQGNI